MEDFKRAMLQRRIYWVDYLDVPQGNIGLRLERTWMKWAWWAEWLESEARALSNTPSSTAKVSFGNIPPLRQESLKTLSERRIQEGIDQDEQETRGTLGKRARNPQIRRSAYAAR